MNHWSAGCDHPIAYHTASGCRYLSYDGRRNERCECSATYEGAIEDNEIYERETVMEQRVKDFERGMYDDAAT